MTPEARFKCCPECGSAEMTTSATCPGCGVRYVSRGVVPAAIQRLMDEVRSGDETPHGLFDRAHNRHNR